MNLGRSWLPAPALAGVFVCVVLALAGCATPQVSSLEQRWPTDIATKAELKNVPFFPQEDYECGPAALSMVFHAAGVRVLPEQLVDQVYLPGRKGSLQVEMLVASRRNGLPAYPLKPELEAVLREVAAGNPVLVFQNLSLPIYPVWHYAVVIGFDQERNLLILNSGRTPRLEMSLFAFERTWARGDYWSMVALSPTRLPVTAQPDGFALSVAALERVNPKAAQTAYIAALKKWPTQRALLLGAGNTAYTLGQPQVALNAYRTTIQVHPDFADGWNNLAQVLLDLGRHQEASDTVAKAIALGGVRLAQYQALQFKINTK